MFSNENIYVNIQNQSLLPGASLKAVKLKEYCAINITWKKAMQRRKNIFKTSASLLEYGFWETIMISKLYMQKYGKIIVEYNNKGI